MKFNLFCDLIMCVGNIFVIMTSGECTECSKSWVDHNYYKNNYLLIQWIIINYIHYSIVLIDINVCYINIIIDLNI